MQKSGEKQMREKDRNSIEIEKMLPQFTTMNVIDGQAGLMSYSSLIFYSLTIDNILNIIVVEITALSSATLSAIPNDIVAKIPTTIKYHQKPPDRMFHAGKHIQFKKTAKIIVIIPATTRLTTLSVSIFIKSSFQAMPENNKK